MPTKPISRYYNFGLTFRWTRGESHIAVKRGYVCEGHAFVVVDQPKNYTVRDRPADDPANDRDTWVGLIPVSPAHWDDDNVLIEAASRWARANPTIADLNQRTDRS